MNMPTIEQPDLYIQEVKRYPMLGAEEEQNLARAWVENQDQSALNKLVTSHLRLTAKLAFQYRHYNLPMADLIAEANIGLIESAKKFDPDRGVRFSTYVLLVCRAKIQGYIFYSNSLVRFGATSGRKTLFFNLNRIKSELGIYDNRALSPDQVTHIARTCRATEAEVVDMDARMSFDLSLNSPVSSDGEGYTQHQDVLEDENADQALAYERHDEFIIRKRLLVEALPVLNVRERDVLFNRKLSDSPMTLKELGKKYGVSDERIRQIESQAFKRLQARIRSLSTAKQLELA